MHTIQCWDAGFGRPWDRCMRAIDQLLSSPPPAGLVDSVGASTYVLGSYSALLYTVLLLSIRLRLSQVRKTQNPWGVYDKACWDLLIIQVRVRELKYVNVKYVIWNLLNHWDLSSASMFWHRSRRKNVTWKLIAQEHAVPNTPLVIILSCDVKVSMENMTVSQF